MSPNGPGETENGVGLVQRKRENMNNGVVYLLLYLARLKYQQGDHWLLLNTIHATNRLGWVLAHRNLEERAVFHEGGFCVGFTAVS